MNAGFQELQDLHVWPELITTSDISVTASNPVLTLPADFRKPYSIRNMTVGSKLKYVDPSWYMRELEDLDEQGEPELYTRIGDVITLWPVPTTTMTVRMVYQRQLSEMTTDGASMPGPDNFHYPIIQAAAYLALQAENEEERAKNAQTQFLAAAERLWGTYSTLEEDEPQQVVNTQGY